MKINKPAICCAIGVAWFVGLLIISGTYGLDRFVAFTAGLAGYLAMIAASVYMDKK